MNKLIIPCGGHQTMSPQQLQFAPWSAFPYKPYTAFTIGHNNQSIFLDFFVKEASIRAAAGEINGKVWEDSCVEFFIAFDDQGYYNLEFNCIGTILIGFGKGKSDRIHVAEEKIKKISYSVSIKNDNDGLIHWQLTVIIPLESFAFHQLSSLSKKIGRGNFYKCGDNLPRPHFIAWNNIETDQPDFHRPEFFGELLFE